MQVGACEVVLTKCCSFVVVVCAVYVQGTHCAKSGCDGVVYGCDISDDAYVVVMVN